MKKFLISFVGAVVVEAENENDAHIAFYNEQDDHKHVCGFAADVLNNAQVIEVTEYEDDD